MKIQERLGKLGRRTGVLLVFGLLMTGLASGALLEFFGTITGTVTVAQSVLVDEGNYLQINTYVTPSVAGNTIISDSHTLTNNAEVTATVNFETGVIDGITTTYLKETEYSFVDTVGTQPVDITVEDLGDSIKWTIDYPMTEPYDPLGNGKLTVGLVIAIDGEPVFQIHNNDGTDATYDWGTWLMSPWGPTIDDGWMGWHSSYDNTPLTELDWVSATGERDRENNPDGIFTITIDKSELGEDFHWALNLAIGTGFNDYDYEQMSVPDGVTPYFDWANPLVDMDVPNYVYAELVGALELPLTLQPGEILSFYIVNDFNVALTPGTYTITTNISPN